MKVAVGGGVRGREGREEGVSGVDVGWGVVEWWEGGGGKRDAVA